MTLALGVVLAACGGEPVVPMGSETAGRVGDPPTPNLDPDGDGILGKHDACPAEPEDMDRWQDEDGCPDAPDEDQDYVVDSCDQCPAARETLNGAADEDGCPDLAERMPRLPALWFDEGAAEPVSESVIDVWAALLNERANLVVFLRSEYSPDASAAVLQRRVKVAAAGLLARGVAPFRINVAVGYPPDITMEPLDFEEARAANGGVVPPVVTGSVDRAWQSPQRLPPCDPPVGVSIGHGPMVLEGAAARSVQPAANGGPGGYVIDPPAPLALACARVVKAIDPEQVEGASCRRLSPVVVADGQRLPSVYVAEVTLPWGPDLLFFIVFESSAGVVYFFETGDEPLDMGSIHRRGLTGMRFVQAFEGGPEELLIDWTVIYLTGEDYEIVGGATRPLEWTMSRVKSYTALCSFDEPVPECRAVQSRHQTTYAEKRNGRFTSRHTDHAVSIEWLPDRRVRISQESDDAGPLAQLLGTYPWPNLPRQRRSPGAE